MIVYKSLTTHSRQSGKTTALIKKAIEMDSLDYRVYFVIHNRNTGFSIGKKLINSNVKWGTLNTFPSRITPKTNISPEMLLVNTGEIYIFLDEYKLMDQTKLDHLLNSLTVSKHNFCVIGVST